MMSLYGFLATSILAFQEFMQIAALVDVTILSSIGLSAVYKTVLQNFYSLPCPSHIQLLLKR